MRALADIVTAPGAHRYAFEDLDIPRDETEYLKVVYSAKHRAPPIEDIADGGKTFQRIMGAHTPPLEHFLLKRKLMGPSWIRIKNPRSVLAPTLLAHGSC